MILTCFIYINAENSEPALYEVIDSSTNRIIDICWMGMDGRGDTVETNGPFSGYVGIEWKEFLNEKYRIDLGIYSAISVTKSPIYANWSSQDTTIVYFHPILKFKVHYPLLYKKSTKTLKVKTKVKRMGSNWVKIYYKNKPTIKKQFLNFHGGIYSGAFDRRAIIGINYTSFMFANIKMHRGNKKILRYFDFGLEYIYTFDYSDFINRQYMLIDRKPAKMSFNIFSSYTPEFSRNLRIYMEIGGVPGDFFTYSLGTTFSIPIINKRPIQ